jgi:hypothetical protein
MTFSVTKRKLSIGLGLSLAACSSVKHFLADAESHYRTAKVLTIGVSYPPGRSSDRPVDTTSSAHDVGERLRAIGNHVTSVSLSHDDPTAAPMLAHISTFAHRLQRNDIAFVYIAAHGVHYQSANYLYDANGATLVAVDDIISLFRSKEPVQQDRALQQDGRVLILVIDACRGPLDDHELSAIRADGHSDVPTPDLVAFDANIDGTIVFSATAGTKTPATGHDYGPVGDYTPFAKALIRRLPERLEFSDILLQVTSDVKKDQAPIPWHGGSGTRSVFLAGPPIMPQT